jgi:hypothetical protein
MFPMAIREQLGDAESTPFLDKVAAGEELIVPSESLDLRGYVDLALRSGFPVPALRLTDQRRQLALESYLEQLLTHDVGQLEQSRPSDAIRSVSGGTSRPARSTHPVSSTTRRSTTRRRSTGAQRIHTRRCSPTSSSSIRFRRGRRTG